MKEILLAVSFAICLAALPHSASAAPSYFLAGSGTNKLDATGLAQSAASVGISIQALGNTTEKAPGIYTFGIGGGGVEAGTGALESVSFGGFNLSNSSGSITFNAPIVNTIGGQAIMTFIVTVNGQLQGRYAIFFLTSPTAGFPSVLTAGDRARTGRLAATLSPDGAAFLNSTFGTSFTQGLATGTVAARAVVGGPLP